jgi:FAD/FMN-containing dehydrogenase
VGAVKSAGGVGKAIREGAKLAVAGRRFMSDVKWSFHVMIEEGTDAAAEAALASVRRIVKSFRGRELPDSIPRIVRANPFGPVNNMIGPEGERWVPVHGLVPHSRALQTMERIEALFASHAEQWERLGIETGYLLATVSTNCFVIEPVFFWPDELMEIHRRSVEEAHLARLRGFERNIPAREAVTEARRELVSLLSDLGAVHLQVAKAYPYREGLRPEAFTIVAALKRVLDPTNRLNPGCLGLGGD